MKFVSLLGQWQGGTGNRHVWESGWGEDIIYLCYLLGVRINLKWFQIRTLLRWKHTIPKTGEMKGLECWFSQAPYWTMVNTDWVHICRGLGGAGVERSNAGVPTLERCFYIQVRPKSGRQCLLLGSHEPQSEYNCVIGDHLWDHLSREEKRTYAGSI